MSIRITQLSPAQRQVPAVPPTARANGFQLEGLGFIDLTAMSQTEMYIRSGLGAAGAYHGYKRNGTVVSALIWSTLSSLFPIVAIPVALAQGFGDPA